MDFRNRVTIPSVKNFQIEDSMNNVIFQFGRVGKDNFTMDFKVGSAMERADPLVPTLPISSLLHRVNTICCVTCLFFEFQKIGLLLATVF